MTHIPGSTIHLRDLTHADLDTFRHWEQPGHQWQALDGPYYARPSAADIDKRVAAIAGRIDAGRWPDPRTRLMIADGETGALLGQVSRYWISEESQWAAVGIVIYDPTHWRRGIGYQALGLWTDYLFHSFPDWVRLDLRTWSGNRGMMGLAQKLGYREEARFRRARRVDGEYFDGMGYGILRAEWQERFPEGFIA